MPLNDDISVTSIYDAKKKQQTPAKIEWRNRTYKISRIAAHIKIHRNQILHHLFTVSDGHNHFQLNYNTDNLSWKLESISS